MSEVKEMTTSQEQWIIDFAKKAKNHKQWLTFIRYGLPTLIKNQPLFIELIINEARRVNDVEDLKARTLNDDVVKIFHELDLKITTVTPKTNQIDEG